jgi:hypothetical protein
MNETQAMLEQLHDIEGLDVISIWPLAIGWWIVLGTIILALIGTWYLIKRMLFKRSWKYDTLQKLNYFLKKLSEPSVTNTTIQDTTILFSEYLRRIALHRYSRSSCAGLTGETWLEWLSKHDSKKFDWMNQGKLLIKAPYAPTNEDLTAEQLKTLIKAAKEWVR